MDSSAVYSDSFDATATRLSTTCTQITKRIREVRTQYRDAPSLLDELSLESELLVQSLDKIMKSSPPSSPTPSGSSGSSGPSRPSISSTSSGSSGSSSSSKGSRAPRGTQLVTTLDKALQSCGAILNTIQLEIDKFNSGTPVAPSRSSTNMIEKTKGALRARKLRQSLVSLKSHRDALNFMVFLMGIEPAKERERILRENQNILQKLESVDSSGSGTSLFTSVHDSFWSHHKRNQSAEEPVSTFSNAALSHPWSKRPGSRPVSRPGTPPASSEGALFRGLGCATRVAGAHFAAPLHQNSSQNRDRDDKATHAVQEIKLQTPKVDEPPPFPSAPTRASIPENEETIRIVKPIDPLVFSSAPAFPTPQRDVTELDIPPENVPPMTPGVGAGVWSGIYMLPLEEPHYMPQVESPDQLAPAVQDGEQYDYPYPSRMLDWEQSMHVATVVTSTTGEPLTESPRSTHAQLEDVGGEIGSSPYFLPLPTFHESLVYPSA